MDLALSDLMQLLPRMRPRDVEEILGASRHSTLESWAMSRVESPGNAWTLLVNGQPVWCGGVLEGAVRGIGALWMVGARGCERYVKHVLRTWRVIIKDGGFRRLECKVYAGNEKANTFAQRAGFQLEGTLRGYSTGGEDVNQYGMLIGGPNGRRW